MATRLPDLTWGRPWPLPFYDEPEDNPAGFPAWLAEHGGKGPLAIGYWDIAKAKKLDVWVERGVTFLYFNWYPACSAIPKLFRWAYVPFKTLQYRLWYSEAPTPVRLTLFEGFNMKDGDKDEYGYSYWYSDRLNKWSWFWFKWLMWPRPVGRVLF